MATEVKVWQTKAAANADANVRAEELEQRNTELATVNTELRGKLSNALAMLRSLQQSGDGDIAVQAGPDHNASAQRCTPPASEAAQSAARHSTAGRAEQLTRDDGQNDVRSWTFALEMLACVLAVQ